MEQISPFPPTDLIDQAEEEEAIRIAPAVELKEWVIKNFLTIGGQLHNPDHDHISELLHDDETFLAFAWASSACQSKKRMVLGQCEKVMFNQGGWKKARQEQQMRDWFGCVPVYLITIDASFCEQASDHDFCALIEHELITLVWNAMEMVTSFTATILAYQSITWQVMMLKSSMV